MIKAVPVIETEARITSVEEANARKGVEL